jgi:hypothetical protein
MGVDEIQFTPLINVHKEAAILSLSDGEKKHIISLLEACEGEQRIKHNASFIKSLYKDSIPAVRNKEASLVPSFGELTCIHLWKTLVISEDGYLSPCSLIKVKLCKIDNNMLEAWDSKELNILRTRILKGEFINPACVECCGPLRNETRDFNEYKLEKAKLVKGSGN